MKTSQEIIEKLLYLFSHLSSLPNLWIPLNLISTWVTLARSTISGECNIAWRHWLVTVSLVYNYYEWQTTRKDSSGGWLCGVGQSSGKHGCGRRGQRWLQRGPTRRRKRSGWSRGRSMGRQWTRRSIGNAQMRSCWWHISWSSSWRNCVSGSALHASTRTPESPRSPISRTSHPH